MRSVCQVRSMALSDTLTILGAARSSTVLIQNPCRGSYPTHSHVRVPTSTVALASQAANRCPMIARTQEDGS